MKSAEHPEFAAAEGRVQAEPHVLQPGVQAGANQLQEQRAHSREELDLSEVLGADE